MLENAVLPKLQWVKATLIKQLIVDGIWVPKECALPFSA